MNAHTPTEVVAEVYAGKSALLAEWEQAPIAIQMENYEYIADLIRRVRRIRGYLTHRKDSPI